METFLEVILVLFVLVLCFLFLTLLKINLILKFLRFKMENYFDMQVVLDNLLNIICQKEGITVFYKTFDELNEGIDDEMEKAVGRYNYTMDIEYQEKLNKALREIEEIEDAYKLSYEKVCELVGHKTNIKKEEFILPRISIADHHLKHMFGLYYYYSTFFHELGHHFAVKEMGKKHTESDADYHAKLLIQKHLPKYYRLIFSRYFDIDAMSFKEEISLYFNYFVYYFLTNKIKGSKICNMFKRNYV